MKTRKSSIVLAIMVTGLLAACSLGPDVTGVTENVAVDRATTYTEGFEACTATGTSYVTGSFTGNNSIKWYYVSAAWSGGTITGAKTPVLGMGKSPAASVYATVTTGVGTLSFKAKKPYTTAVSIAVKINGVTKATFTTSSTTAVTAGPYTINMAGTVKIELVQSSTSAGQAAVDDITWTSYTTTSSSSSVSSSSSSSSSTSPTVLNEDFTLSQTIRDYYRSAYGKSGTTLRTALKTIISTGYVDKGYTGLWTTYKTSDVTPAGKIWDLYSNTDNNGTGSTASYWYTPVTSQCGTYSAEGGCYNREHMVPQSTFAEAAPMVSDAHHVTATDGKVNGMRSNYPHGNVATATWTSLNGGKLGAGTSTQGYTGTCFEPRADAKGDIARIYMYFAIRYYGDSRCTAWASMGAGAKLLSWSQNLYRSWSAADPVSSKEKTRNEAIYTIQKNRNPLIDYPVIATLIDFTL
ncbi:MAG TPA: endonuclease [Spirochaetota bacterium]|nr:endonuclease [Spirochaetota bacterium]